MISSLQHTIVKKILKLKIDASFRKSEGLCLLVSDKVIQEVAPHKEIVTLFYKEGSQLHKVIPAKEKIAVSSTILTKFLGYDSDDTLAAVMNISNEHSRISAPFLVLDSIQDPGNLGTLLRSACAFGFKSVALINGCCDLYNDKALKSARGASFLINCFSTDLSHIMSYIKSSSSELYFADMKGTPLKSCSFKSPFGIVLGNEGHGVSSSIKAFAKGVAIEMNPLSESLNVSIAGSILMYEATRPPL
jgi:TrmH family RNA methyltransferase